MCKALLSIETIPYIYRHFSFLYFAYDTTQINACIR